MLVLKSDVDISSILPILIFLFYFANSQREMKTLVNGRECTAVAGEYCACDRDFVKRRISELPISIKH